MKKDSQKKNNTDFAVAEVLLPLDTIKEVEVFFPIKKPKTKNKYGLLTVKVNEIDEGTKEIIYGDDKKKFSRTINIHEDYSKEEVIFYSYVLLHAKYNWNPFSSATLKSKKATDSNLEDFCHDFFSKAKDYTYKGNRDEFSQKRIFEMYLYCSVKTKEEYDLPPFEEYWRVFNTKGHLLPTTYELLLSHETNSIRKEAVAHKAFVNLKEFSYLRHLLEQLFTRCDYKEYIKLYLNNTDTIYEDGNFPYTGELYFCFVESCIKVKDFVTLKNNISDEDRMFLGGRYTKSFVEGITAYFEGKYSSSEKLFKNSILSDDEGRDVTRCTTVFYVSSLLKQKKYNEAQAHIFDLKPREPHIENYDLDHFGYKNVEKQVLEELLKLYISEEQKNSLHFYDASLLHEKSWHILDKSTAEVLLKKLKAVQGYDDDYTYNYLLSEAYSKLGAYNKAYETMLKSMAGQKEDIYPSYSIDIEKTTEDFQERLPAFIKENFLYSSPRRFEALKEGELQHIIDYWWKRKRYYLITELCEVIDEHGSIGDFDEYWFEFAYSYKEMDDIEKAKKYYEDYVNKKGENSSVLNNLAIIYEQLGNMKKAKEVIKKAYQLSDGNDAIVNRNKKRLVDDGTKQNTSAPEKKTEEGKKPEPDYIEYDLDYGKLTYKNEEVTVRSSKMMPFILKELFTEPTKSQEATDILLNANLDDMTSDRSLGDCIRQINAKIKKLGIKENVFSYRSEKVLTPEHFLKRLRIKVSQVESK